MGLGDTFVILPNTEFCIEEDEAFNEEVGEWKW